MQAFTAEKTELLATYGADANRGLTEAQARKNKEQYGENALTRRKPDTLLKRLWDAATEPMLLMLIAAGLIALAVNIVRQVLSSHSKRKRYCTGRRGQEYLGLLGISDRKCCHKHNAVIIQRQ